MQQRIAVTCLDQNHCCCQCPRSNSNNRNSKRRGRRSSYHTFLNRRGIQLHHEMDNLNNGISASSSSRRGVSVRGSGRSPINNWLLRRKPRRSIEPGEFFQRSYMHGLYDFYNASSLRLKLFWGVAILAALLMAIYGWSAIIIQFKLSPVVVSYMVHESMNRTLPDVVICPFARFNQSYFDRHNISDELVEYIQSVFSPGATYPFNLNMSVGGLPANAPELELQLLQKLAVIGGDRNFTFDELLDEASFRCKDIIQYCVSYKGGNVKIRDCCSEATPVLTGMGKCYRLIGPEQISSGFGFGLTVMVKVPEDRYLTVGANTLFNEGISVKLVETGKGLDFDLTYIPSGTHALMPLRAVRYEFLQDPPRYHCLDSESENNEYSALRCFDKCFFRAGMVKCNCSQVTLRDVMGMPTCHPPQLYGCLLTEIAEKYVNRSLLFSQCRQQCLPPCKYWQYHPTVSFANFPSSALFFYVPELQAEQWRKMIVLDVFYEKLEFTKIKHFPSMTLDSFISNLGGQLSLWVGGSILSLIQFTIFLCLYVYSKFTGNDAASSVDLQTAATSECLKSEASETRLMPASTNQLSFDYSTDYWDITSDNSTTGGGAMLGAQAEIHSVKKRPHSHADNHLKMHKNDRHL